MRADEYARVALGAISRYQLRDLLERLANLLVVDKSEVGVIIQPVIICNPSLVHQNINDNQATWTRHDGVDQGNVLLDYLFSFFEY